MALFTLMLAAQPALGAATVTWTTVIPKAFPGIVYTWHLRPDGTYSEDGRYATTGKPAQPTLLGHWGRKGNHMMLRQGSFGYVFDGAVVGQSYYGDLFQGTAKISSFCARQGDAPPSDCGGNLTS